MSGAGADAEKQDVPSESTKPDLTALVSAASALVTAVGAFALTGALGRVQRNSGELFAAAIGAVIFGAMLAAVGSLVSTQARPSLSLKDRNVTLRGALQASGVVVTAVGLAFGLGVSVDTADNDESPSLRLSTSEGDGVVTGVASAAA